MRRLNMLSLAGATAVAGLLLAPALASADLNKCGKEVAKNSAKMEVDAQKELQKCVDNWLKEVDKAAANVAKGKTIEGKAYAGLFKAGGKCQASLAKIYGDTGDKVTLVSDIASAPKGKLGKGYDKIAGSANGLFAKGKCGPKAGTLSQAQDELEQLGLGRDFDVAARILANNSLDQAWAVQSAANASSAEAFDGMIPDRCAKTGVTCFDNTDCPLHSTYDGPPGLPKPAPVKPNDDDQCSTTCPNCGLYGRGITAAGPVVVGNYTGPCGRMTCQLGGGTLIQNIVPPLTIPVAFTGLLNMSVCDENRVLADAYTIHGSADRTNKATLGGVILVCVDTISANGYIKKTAGTGPPSVDVAACADGDIKTSNECSAFATCGTPAARTSLDGVDLPGPETVTCLDTSPTAGVPAAGDASIRLSLRLTTGNLGTVGPDLADCTGDDTVAPGGVTTIALTTQSASAAVFNAGSGGTFGANSGAVAVGPGVPFDVTPTGIARGVLGTADLVGAFSAIDSNGTSLGDSMTAVTLDCL